MGTLTVLSGECVTFDQNGRKCNFGLLAANLPNRISSVIQTIGRIVKARMFWYFEFFKFRMMTSFFREASKTTILEEI